MNPTVLRTIYWTIILGFVVWCFYRSIKETHEPGVLLKRWAGTLIILAIGLPIIAAFLKAGGYAAGYGMPIVTAAMAVPLSMIWASSWGEMLAAPLTSLFDGGNAHNRAVPLYAIAEARQKRGRYAEAIEEVNKQLERFPGDITGTLMLVDLHARDLKEMAPAQAAVESYLSEGPHHPKNTFLVLTHLAEAYLTHARDRENAKQCLERVQELCIGTEQEIAAAQRLAHLASDEHLASRAEPKRIQLQTYDRSLGLRGETPDIRPNEPTPEERANQYIEQLNEHPLDLETRENLALLYANHYKRLDLAIDQLETMVAFRNQAPKHQVRWLNLMADLHIKLAANVGDARRCLERICQLYPDSSHEAQARKRMHFLGLEKKGRHS